MIKQILISALLAGAAFAGWPQFQCTPDNHGRDKSVFIDRANIDTVLKMDMGIPMYAAPVVSGDTLIAACINGTVYAINWKTADILWTYHAPSGITSTPAMDDGHVYVGVRDGCVYALDRFSGIPDWTFCAEDTLPAEREIQAPIKMTANRLYVGCFNGRLYCLDKNGNKKWAFQTHYYIKDAPSIRDSLIALSSRDEGIYLLKDLGDSVRFIWKNRVVEYGQYVPGSVGRCSPVMAGNYVFTNSAEAECGHFTRALSLDSGKSTGMSDYSNFNTTGFAVTENGLALSNIQGYTTNPLGKAFGASGGYMRFLRSNAAPIIIGNYLVFHSSYYPKGVFLMDPASFVVRDSIKMDAYTVSTSFAAADSVLFFGTYEGVLFGMGNGVPVVGSKNRETVLLGDMVLSPNPFNPETGIRFALARKTDVSLKAFNILGKQVWSYNAKLGMGYHTIRWNASHLSSGVYYLRAEAGSFRKSFKVTLIK